jgi:glycosyltransferase involved in cell wall biosynthesis
MKYIFHICPDFSNPLYHNLFFELENLGQKNIVYVPGLLRHIEGPYETKFLDRSFNIVDRFLFFRKQKIIYKNIVDNNYLKKNIKKIHAHTLFSSGYTAYRLHKETNIPYIVAIRDVDVNYFFKYMIHLRIVGVNIMKYAEKIIFLSNTYKKFILTKMIPKALKGFIDEKSIVIPNGINEYFLKNKNCVKRLSLPHIKILFVGKLTKRKNIKTTIKTCLLLKKLGYNVTYTIIGDPINNLLRRHIDKFSFINYYPRSSKEVILQSMRDNDLFVMPSVTETFGLVYAEAMSQGLPVIYTRGQGFDGNFADGCVGYAVDCYDYREITKRIIDIISNYATISENCIKNVDKFCWKTIAREYKNLYIEAKKLGDIERFKN